MRDLPEQTGKSSAETTKFNSSSTVDSTNTSSSVPAILNQETPEDIELSYRPLGEAIMHHVWTTLPDGTVDYMNRRALDYYGLTEQQVLKDGWHKAVHPDDLHKSLETWSTFLANGGDYYEIEVRLKRSDGVYRWHLIRSTAKRDAADGEIIKWFGTSTDVHDQKQAEDSLQANISLLASMFEATADGILVVDLTNTIVTYNKQFINMWRIPPEIMNSRDNVKTVNYVLSQLSNAEEFAEATRKLVEKPETKNLDVLEFKDGRIYERYSQPQLKKGIIVGRVLSFRDITERRKAEKALQESQERYQQLFDSNPYPIWVYDLETLEFLAVNREAARHYGFTQEEFLRMTIKDIRPPEDVPLLLDSVAKIAAIEIATDKTLLTRSFRHQKKDGKIIEVQIASQPVTFRGRHARIVLATDFTERNRADASLRESEMKFRVLVESTNEGIMQCDDEERIQFVNNRFCEMVGYTQSELIGKDWSRLLLDEAGREFVANFKERRRKKISDRYELNLKKKSGEILWVIIGGTPILNSEGVVVGSMGIFTDITERKLAEEQLLHDAFHDNLTGLANRSLFMDHLRITIERGRGRDGKMYAVLFLDFDRFKVVNDSLGHAEGDKLLKFIARRVESCIRTGSLVARIGGDEFVILLDELNEADDAMRVAERIQESLKTPFKLGGKEVFITVSVGIALSTTGYTKPEDMLRDADIAMYRAKAKGKAQHQVFNFEMQKQAMSQLQLETEIRYALERGEFRIYYQPIYCLETKNLFGFESLIRWQHPERGLVLPAEFIPVAEETGMIIKLGRWAVYESCRQLREWQEKYPGETSSLKIGVNISGKEFLQKDLAEQIGATLSSTKLEPRCLKLEITESHIMENSETAVTVMNQLRALGIELSLDDFGTGYSSLSYLHRLPVSYLKIDRSFINDLEPSRENAEIVSTIIKLAQNLKMKVIAEGIETIEQFDYLKKINCEYGQGYFFSKPLDAEKAQILIETNGENLTGKSDRRAIDFNVPAAI